MADTRSSRELSAPAEPELFTPWIRLRVGSRKWLPARAAELLGENRQLHLPCDGGFLRAYVELEAEADRQSRIWDRKSRVYANLYVMLGLPAAVLAAIAGATALSSTTGRVVAGVIALASSAVLAAVTFLDSAKKRDESAGKLVAWADLYNEMHMCRLTKLADFDMDDGPLRLTNFAATASAIRAGRDPEAVQVRSAAGPPSDAAPRPMFPAFATDHRYRMLT